MNNIGLKIAAFLLACGFGILTAFSINGSASRWAYLYYDEPSEQRSCQVKLIDRNGETYWMSCLQWQKHQEFVLEHSN